MCSVNHLFPAVEAVEVTPVRPYRRFGCETARQAVLKWNAPGKQGETWVVSRTTIGCVEHGTTAAGPAWPCFFF